MVKIVVQSGSGIESLDLGALGRDGVVTTAQASMISYSIAPDTVVTVNGSGFTYGANNELLTGTVNSIRVSTTGVAQISYSEMSLHAREWQAFVQAGLNDAFRAYILDDADTIQGGQNAEEIFGHAGSDLLLGNGGDDSLFGGDGNDTLISGDGNDELIGDDGIDTASYRNAAGAIVANLVGEVVEEIDAGTADSIESIERIIGSAFDDTMVGASGDTTLNGLAGDDHIVGGTDSDIIIGGAGSDSMFGLSGDDRFLVDDFDDYIVGGDGFDRVSFAKSSSGLLIDRTQHTNYHSIEQFIGTRFDDTIIGDASNERLKGASGNDTVFGNAGADTLYGDDGDDFLEGGAGIDRIFGDSGNDTLDGGASSDVVYGGAGDDIVLFDPSDSFVLGGPGRDTLLIRNIGEDILIRGLSVNGNSHLSSIEIFITSRLSEQISLQRPGTVNAAGGNDVLTGFLGTQYLFGASGDDSIFGDAGEDRLTGGQGNDTLDGGADDDFLNGVTGDDSMRGGQGDDQIVTGRGVDTLFGNGGADLFDIRFSSADSSASVTIGDFNDGVDTITFASDDVSGFTSLADVVAASAQSGADVVITAAAGFTVTIENFLLADLSADDFQF